MSLVRDGNRLVVIGLLALALVVVFIGLSMAVSSGDNLVQHDVPGLNHYVRNTDCGMNNCLRDLNPKAHPRQLVGFYIPVTGADFYDPLGRIDYYDEL